MRDSEAKALIASWDDSRFESAGWSRLRHGHDKSQPYLFVPGSRDFSIVPDGLYGRFRQDNHDYIEAVDILAFEVCTSRQNFYDKRSRYAEQNPLGLYCQPSWLRIASFIKNNPDTELQNIPVRYRAVTFALSDDEFSKAKYQLSPWGNEYFVRHGDLAKVPELIAIVAAPCSRFLLPKE